jgi:hypothetical protein
MASLLLITLFRVLAGMFLIGMLGCLVVIPITAYRLFRVLFEDDGPDEAEAQA